MIPEDKLPITGYQFGRTVGPEHRAEPFPKGKKINAGKTDYTIASELEKLSLCLRVMKCQLKREPECLLQLITMTVMMSKRLTCGVGSTEFSWLFTKRKRQVQRLLNPCTSDSQ